MNSPGCKPIPRQAKPLSISYSGRNRRAFRDEDMQFNLERKFTKKIGGLYSDHHLDELARKTGFMERESKLKPKMFLETVMFKELNN